MRDQSILSSDYRDRHILPTEPVDLCTHFTVATKTSKAKNRTEQKRKEQI